MEHGYRNLEVWQFSRELANLVYDLTTNFPKEEIYGLTNQMRRSAVSVASNIAEGNERHGKKEFIHFIGIARGSLAELETQAIIANDRNFMERDNLGNLLELTSKIAKMLWGLRKSLERDNQ
ncbi:MAG: four helix bundle protein [Alphaproteobacteria bacterium CG11_big_fil_rev_8_21_14_0_20_44_7]|nr:MAG: four helix bundle protein [Alphaproteobacteria bacterium CG11_big_fil_rev_8_21_14_0_20_44_7]